MRTTLGRKIVTIMSGIILAAAMFINTPAEVMAYQPTVGIVSAAAAKVRKEPNTSSDVVGSAYLPGRHQKRHTPPRPAAHS